MFITVRGGCGRSLSGYDWGVAVDWIRPPLRNSAWDCDKRNSDGVISRIANTQRATHCG
jgi:hypothetical protein